VLILAAFLLGVVMLRIGGCELGRLNHLRLRWWPVAVAALVSQTAIFVVWPTGWRGVHLGVNLCTYAGIAVFLWVNRRISWLWVIAVGTGSNMAAITANGGVMPASRRAISLAHLPHVAGFLNSAPVAHPHLEVLGDVLPTPPWLPLHNVASIGDFLILGGALLLVARAAGDGASLSWSRLLTTTGWSGPRAAR